MNFYEGWNPVLRWILFIPTFFLVYLITNIISAISLDQFIGPYDESSIINYIIHRFYIDAICMGFSIVASAMIAPKGRIVIASLYLGIMVLLFGMSLSVILLKGTYIPTWKLIYSGCTMLVGGIGSLITVIQLQKQENEMKLKNSSDYRVQ